MHFTNPRFFSQRAGGGGKQNHLVGYFWNRLGEKKINVILLIAGMLSWYGFEFEGKASDYYGYYASNPSSAKYNLFLWPMYLMRTGDVNMGTGGIPGLNETLFSWSSATASNGAVYYPRAHLDMIAPSTNDAKMFGFSLR